MNKWAELSVKIVQCARINTWAQLVWCASKYEVQETTERQNKNSEQMVVLNGIGFILAIIDKLIS